MQKIDFELHLAEGELLNVPLQKFNLSIEDGWLFPLIQQVRAELRSCGLLIDINFWYSDEWFCADNSTGVAIPYYLADPKLTLLEKRHGGVVEGESREEAIKLIRHEVGHAIDNGYRLRRRRERSLIFGKASTPYPNSYSYRPYSKSFVRYLGDHYAQSHPVEDFAETFATWLDPNSNWRELYADWPAMKKLEYVDTLMRELAGVRPVFETPTEEFFPIHEFDGRLLDLLAKKAKRYGKSDRPFWNESRGVSRSASRVVNTCKIWKKEICDDVASRTGYPKYIVDHALRSFSKESKRSESIVLKGTKTMATKKIICYHIASRMNKYIEERRHQILL